MNVYLLCTATIAFSKKEVTPLWIHYRPQSKHLSIGERQNVLMQRYILSTYTGV